MIVVWLNIQNGGLLENASTGLWGQAIKSCEREIVQLWVIWQEVRINKVEGGLEKHQCLIICGFKRVRQHGLRETRFQE